VYSILLEWMQTRHIKTEHHLQILWYFKTVSMRKYFWTQSLWLTSISHTCCVSAPKLRCLCNTLPTLASAILSHKVTLQLLADSRRRISLNVVITDYSQLLALQTSECFLDVAIRTEECRVTHWQLVAEVGIGDDSAVAALCFCMQLHIRPSLPKQAHRG
jgi:hypothetical protein